MRVTILLLEALTGERGRGAVGNYSAVRNGAPDVG